MTPWHLRNFLIQQPQPALIRLTADGVTQDMTPGKRSRVKLAESIIAIGPELVECLDSNGGLLRAIRLDGGDDLARSADAAPTPIALQQDPQAAMMSHFANLIHRAYEHATDIAFAKLVELVERMDERSSAIEQRLERTELAFRREQQERIEDLWERAEDQIHSESAPQQMMASLMSGALAGQQARPTNGKTK